MSPRFGRGSWWLVAIVIASIGVLPLAALAYLVESRATESVRNEVRDRLSGNATLTALFLDEQLRGVEEVVASYARREVLLAALVRTGGPDTTELDRQMNELREARADVLNVAGVADLSGRMVGGTVKQPPGADFSDRGWHQAVRRTRQPYVSEALVGRSPGQPLAVSIAAPVVDADGALVAIIVVGYPLDELQEFVDTFVATRGTVVTVTDQDGVVIADPGDAPTSLVSRADDPFVMRALAGASGVADDARGSGGERVLSAYAPVPRLGWSVTAEMPRGTAYAEVDALHRQVVLITVPLAVLFVLGSLLLARSIRARHAAEREQQRVSAQLAQVIDLSPVPTAITRVADGTILLANAAMLSNLGWESGGMVGRTTTEVALWADPENRQAMVERLTRDGRVHQAEERLRRRDGTAFDVITSIEMIEFDGDRCLLGLFYDISDRVRAEQELRASQAWLRAFLTHLPAPAILKDRDGRVLIANEAGAQVYGVTSEALTGRTFAEVLPAPVAQRAEARERAIIETGESIQEEVSLGGPDGTDRVVLALRFPVLDGEDVVGVGAIATDVTELKALEQQARGSAERFRLLLDSTAEGIFGVDTDGRFAFVNPAAAEAFGSSSDELLGKDAHALVHHHRADGSDYPWEQCPTYRTLHEGASIRTDQELFWRHDGTSFPTEYASHPMKDGGTVTGAVMVFSDITARVAGEQALRAYRLMFEHTRDGVLFTSPTGEIHSANPAACHILRMSEDELRRTGRSRLADPTDERWRTGLDGRNRGGRFRGELRMRRGDGSTFVADVSSDVFHDESGRPRASVMFRDVSDRAALLEEKAKAATAAEEASRLKSEFLATMSHEIRTPMNGVMGMTGLLLDTELTDEQREYAETVRSSAETLLTILNDILDFSKIEAGRLELEEVDFDVAVVAEEVAELLAAAAHAKGLELVVRIDPELPSLSRGDPGRVRQVLMNLVGNAIKFTDQGSVQLTVAADPADPADPAVRFEVCDTGIGVTPQAQQRLFESFTQAEAATTRRYGGTGLGLAISRRLVELMGGGIGVDSALGEGSTFWFSVPLRRSDAPAPARPETLVGLRALVVDDVAINCTALVAQLAAWGITSVAVPSGEEAMAAVARAQVTGEPFDIVFADFQMPGMDGLELADAVAHTVTDPPPVVVLSSAGGRDSVQGRSSTAVARFLVKPARRSQLFDAIATALGEAPSRRVTTAPAADASPQVVGGRVLVADDNAVNQRLATLLLEKAGYRVDAVADGAEAVLAVRRRQYDAVLMDCEMPGMDGYAAAAEIRREQAGRRVPIIAVTASAMKGDVERALAAGMDAHVAKPIDRAELARVLRELLDGTPAEPPAEESVPVPAHLQPAALDQLRDLDDDALRSLAEIFIRTAPARVRQLAEAARAGDCAGAAAAAHSLKGSAATFGATDLAQLASLIEHDARAGQSPPAETVKQVEESLSLAVAALEHEIGELPPG